MVRERMTSKEQEVLGQWLTQERMEKSGDFTKTLGCKHFMLQVASSSQLGFSNKFQPESNHPSPQLVYNYMSN